MPSFTILHNQPGPASAAALSQTMDILALSGNDGSIALHRWVAWQRILSLADADTPPVGALSWTPDGQQLAIRRSDGQLSILPVERSAAVLCSRGDAGPGALCWITAVRAESSGGGAGAGGPGNGQGRAGQLPDLTLDGPAAPTRIVPVTCTSPGVGAYNSIQLPEPLPVGPDETALPFLSWDNDRLADVLRAGAGNGNNASGAAGGGGSGGAPPSATALAYSSSSSLGIGAGPSGAVAGSGGRHGSVAGSASASGHGSSLANAALSVASAAAAITLGGGARASQHPQLPGAAQDPSAVLRACMGTGPLQVLAVVERAGGRGEGQAGTPGPCVLRILAHGTVPILQVALPITAPPPAMSVMMMGQGMMGGHDLLGLGPMGMGMGAGGAGAADTASIVPVRVSIAPDLSSAAVLATVPSGGDAGQATPTATHMCWIDTSPLALACAGGPSAPLPLLLRAITVGDACLRHAVGSVLQACREWGTGHAALISACRELEGTVVKNDTGNSAATLMSVSASYYPHSPVPLATAEVYRHAAVGSTSAGLSLWLEAGIGEAGLVKLSRTLEGALAGLEACIVPRAVRSLELLLVALGDVLQQALSSGAAAIETDGQLEGGSSSGSSTTGMIGPTGVAYCGLTVAALEALSAEVTHALALCQAVRTASAHARAVYSALVAHWRVTIKSWAVEAQERADETEAATAAANARAATPKPVPVRVMPSLAPIDAALLRQAVRPAGVQVPVEATAAGGGAAAGAQPGKRLSSSSAAGASDPLGLGFSTSAGGASSSSAADPLGLGFGSALGSSSETADGAGASSATGTAGNKQEDNSRPVPHDPFLPYSLTQLLCGPSHARAASGLAGSGSASAAAAGDQQDELTFFFGLASDLAGGELLLADYPSRMLSTSTSTGTTGCVVAAKHTAEAPAVRSRSLARQLEAIANRWTAIAALPCLALSAHVGGAGAGAGGGATGTGSSSSTKTATAAAAPTAALSLTVPAGELCTAGAADGGTDGVSTGASAGGPSVPLAALPLLACFDEGWPAPPGWTGYSGSSATGDEDDGQSAATSVPSHLTVTRLPPADDGTGRLLFLRLVQPLAPGAAGMGSGASGANGAQPSLYAAVLLLDGVGQAGADGTNGADGDGAGVDGGTGGSEALSLAWHGPPPGAVAVASAASTAAGLSFLKPPAVPADDDRSVMVLVAAGRPPRPHLAKVPHHNLEYAPVPQGALAAGMVLEWAVDYAPVTAMLQVATAIRELPAAGMTRCEDPGHAAAAGAGILDVSGPRGCAVVAIGAGPTAGSGAANTAAASAANVPRHVLVLDLAEDEEDAAENGGAEAGAEDDAMEL